LLGLGLAAANFTAYLDFVLGVKSTFLEEPDSDGAAVLFLFGVQPADVSCMGESIALPEAFRIGRKMDFSPWNVGSFEVSPVLMGLEAVDETAEGDFRRKVLS
jgi:hypothetical protein